MRSYEPSEFVSKLSTDDLDEPAPAPILGLAKYDQEQPSVIQFSTSLSCDRWFSIPTDLIASIDHLKTIPCQDHRHPLVRITFRAPDPSRPDVAFLLDLVAHMQDIISRATRIARASGAAGRPAPSLRVGAPPCWVQEVPGGLEVCCYDDEQPDIACTGMV